MINSASQYRYVDCNSWHCTGDIYPLRSSANQYRIVGEDVLFLHEALGERVELLTSSKQQFDLTEYTWRVQPGSMAIIGNDLVNVVDNLQRSWTHINQGGFFLKSDYDLSSDFIQVYYNDYEGHNWNRFDEIINQNAKLQFVSNREDYSSGKPLTRQGIDNLYHDMRNSTRALRYGGNVSYAPDKYTSAGDPERPGWYGRVATTQTYDTAYYEPDADILPTYYEDALYNDQIWKFQCVGSSGGTSQSPDRYSGYYQQHTRDGIFCFKGLLPTIWTDYSASFLVRYYVFTSDFEKEFLKEVPAGTDLVDEVLPKLSEWGVHDKTWDPPDGIEYTAIVYAWVNPIFYIGNHTKWW